MPTVKAEPVDARSIPGSDTTAAEPCHRQYVVDRSTRIRDYGHPYRQPELTHYQPPPYHPAIFSQAISQATHETLLGTRNAAYLAALQEITEVRSVAATYQRQAIQLQKDLTDARGAYNQLLSQTEAVGCQEVQSNGPPKDAKASTPAPSSSVSPFLQPALVQLPQYAFHAPGTFLTIAYPRPASINPAPLAPAMTTAHSGSVLALPAETSNSVPSTTTTAQGTTSTNEVYGPVPLPGGFRILPRIGPALATSEVRPVDLPFDVFWRKGDWFGKGHANGSFVTDRNGRHLQYLMKGIRKTARRIWTELAKRPNNWIATTFNKNGLDFKDDYVNTIEEIYPCLKLCSRHWKAKQIGISAYSHWYKNRSRYMDGSVAV